MLFGYALRDIKHEMTWGDFRSNVRIMRVKQEAGQLIGIGLYPSYDDQSERPTPLRRGVV